MTSTLDLLGIGQVAYLTYQLLQRGVQDRGVLKEFSDGSARRHYPGGVALTQVAWASVLGLACGSFGSLSNTPSARFLLDAMDRFQIDHDFEFKAATTSDVLVFVEETGRRLLYRQRPHDVCVPTDKLMSWLERVKGGVLTVDTATLQPTTVSEILASTRTFNPRIFTSVTIVDMPPSRLRESDMLRLLSNADMVRMPTETLGELVVAHSVCDMPAATESVDRISDSAMMSKSTEALIAEDAVRAVATGRKFNLKVLIVTAATYIVVVAAPGWAFSNLVPHWPSVQAIEARLSGLVGATPPSTASEPPTSTTASLAAGSFGAKSLPPRSASGARLSPSSVAVDRFTQWAVFVCPRPDCRPSVSAVSSADLTAGPPHSPVELNDANIWAPERPRGGVTARLRRALSDADDIDPSAPSEAPGPASPSAVLDDENAAVVVSQTDLHVSEEPFVNVHMQRVVPDIPPMLTATTLQRDEAAPKAGATRGVADVTGLEEAFDAGMLAALDVGMPVPFAVLMGQAALGVCVSQFGPVPSHPSSRAAVDKDYEALVNAVACTVETDLACFLRPEFAHGLGKAGAPLESLRAFMAPVSVMASASAALHSTAAPTLVNGDLGAADPAVFRDALNEFRSDVLAPFSFHGLEDSGPAMAAKNSMMIMASQIDGFSRRFDPAVIARVVRMIRSAEAMGGRLHVTGIGKPQHVAQYAASLLSSVGTPCTFLHGTEVTHGSAGQVISGDIVFAISNSGSTREMLDAVVAVKQMGAQVVAVTGGLNSKLAQASDVVLDAKVDEEGGGLGLAPRASIAVEVLVFAALSAALEEARHLSKREYHRRHPAGALGQRSKQ